MSDSRTANQQTESLTGVVERITFSAANDGYTIARLQVPGSRDLVTIVGNFANLQAGQTLRLQGYWKNHPKYGLQLNVVNYQETKPATLTGIEKYLGSGLIRGVGPVFARRIVAHFGLETLEVIESHLDRLVEVPGIGHKRVKSIKDAWETQKAIKEVMVFLQGHGVSTTYAVKIYKQYGDGAIATVTENPYQLADDIYGIGFLSADRIARNLGVSPHSRFRYRAGVLHTLAEAGEDGHCFLPRPELVNRAVEKLSQDDYQAESAAVVSVIEEMAAKEELMVELAEGNMPLCYKPAFYYGERHLAKLLKERLNQPLPVKEAEVASWLGRYTHSQGIDLSPQQHKAVLMAATHRVMVLTGGPGCGKTFCTRTIVALWQGMGLKVALAAPTGRAAQRLGEMTGLEAKTIHRLLEFDPATFGFKRNQDRPIPAQAIVIDEASMLDLFLAHSLLKAVPADAYLLLVGDYDQLPSVGPGNVLRDLIASQQVPVMRLTQVFRQAASSAIIQAAHAINRGQYPRLEFISDHPQSDCLWHSGGSEPEHGVQVTCELISDLLPRLGYHPATDVQVLCPMTRGTVGTHHFNQVLQELINPPHPDKLEVDRGGTKFREGDRVIQKKNNYQLEVFNGDLGVITKINRIDQELAIGFDGREVTYDYADLNEIGLAYAVTIHKSQGSEYPVVILPLYMQHFILLSKNLFYTGLTRARKLAIVIGQKKPIGIAVNQVKDNLRYTRLKERLMA